MPPRPRPLSRLLTQAATPPPHRQSPSWRAPPVWNLRHAHQPRTAAAPSRAPRDTPSQRLLLSYHDLERALERRGLNTARVLLLSAMAAAAGFGLAWPRIKKWGAVEGAEVAVASLETERLQQRAVGMVRDVLADRRTGKQVERLLKEAVVGLFGDEEFMARSVEWTASVLVEALSKEEVLSSGERYLENVVKERRESVEEVLTQVVANVAADEAVQDTVAQGLWTGVRASVIGRRRPHVLERDEKKGEEVPKRPESEERGAAPNEEGVVAPSPLDESKATEYHQSNERDLG